MGDSLVIEVAQGFASYWWNTGNPNDQGEDKVVVFPTQDFTYVVEVEDNNGCEARTEIFVDVDTCATGIMDILSAQVLMYPNPTKGDLTIKLPSNEVFDISIFDMSGRLVKNSNNISEKYLIKKGNLDIASYIVKLQHKEGVITEKIVIR